MNKVGLTPVSSRQTTHVSLTGVAVLLVFLGSSAFLQAQYEPVSPIAPTSVEECKTFSLAMSAFLRTMSKAHEQCLVQKIKEGAKASMESDSRICSQPACQQYHMDPNRARDENQRVSACYQEANQYVARRAEEKRLEEDRQKRRDADQALADQQRRDRAADQQKQQQPQADKQAQQKQQQPLADKERAATAAERAAAERATHLKAQAEDAKRGRENQERIAAGRNAEELQRLEAQQNASREKALADQIQRHRSQLANDSEAAQPADRSDANGKQVLATMNDPFGTSRNGKTDTGTDVGSIADGPNPFAGTVEKQEAQKTNVPTVAAVSRSIAEYMQSAGDAWKSLNEESHFTASFKLASDALSMAKTASGGEAPTTIPTVALLAAYVDKEGTVLDTLALKSTGDWIQNSGVNSPDRSTIPAAQSYLDDFSKRLATIQRLNQQLLPTIQAAHDVLANPVVDDARMAIAHSTLPGMDPIALEDIIARLNGCSSQIDAIQNNLRLARSVIY